MTPYAKTEVALIIFVGAAVTAATAYYLSAWAIIPAVVALALLSFYRDPRRRVPPGDNLLVAPADGKVTDVVRNQDAGDGQPAEWRICIFLSIVDVHINRSPCCGRVTDVKYSPGEFLNALRAEAAERNESNLVTIDPRPPIPGPVRVRQIAGVLARRIVCRAEPGEELSAGDRFGMIKLGSRTEIRVPEDARWDLAVRVGDSVKAGTTVLARLKPA
jgi:phosphatidylserine decarboxylase